MFWFHKIFLDEVELAEQQRKEAMTNIVTVSRQTFNELALAMGVKTGITRTRLVIRDDILLCCDDITTSMPCCNCGQETINDPNHNCKKKMTREEAFKLAEAIGNQNLLNEATVVRIIEALGLIKFEEEKKNKVYIFKTWNGVEFRIADEFVRTEELRN